LTINAVIKQTCITLLTVYVEKNLEYFIFCQATDYATLILDWSKCWGVCKDTSYHNTIENAPIYGTNNGKHAHTILSECRSIHCLLASWFKLKG
jgi:hypothetical protein